MNFDSVQEAIEDIKLGKLVVVIDDEDRENEGDLIMAAEKATPQSINFMATEGRGLICVPVSEKIADKLELKPMVVNNQEPTNCNFTVSVDLRGQGVTTGISASDRAKTAIALADPKSKATDFLKPGHIFPLRAKDGGVLVRAGHTEAAVDLARLAGFREAGVLVEIAKEDGEMMRTEELFKFAAKHDLKIITIKSIIEYRHKTEKFVEKLASAVLPTKFGDFQMDVYRNNLNGDEHVVMHYGDLDVSKPVLTRVHSECLTGEVFSSLKCDCGQQLEAALEQIANNKSGVLLYMRNHEGRGIGLVNKIKAYDLQNQGLDTVEANEKLGFADDLREYGIGAQILVDLGIKEVHLMTNNPRKIVGIEGYGLKVTKRIPLEIAHNKVNKSYLKVKKTKLGHLLNHI
jgi:3,4-dihydroxy 2-butanone 4-phosphate synthase/GTP cyclohydrolase II